MSLNTIIAAQSRWASHRWPGHDGGRAPSLEANLMIPMTSSIQGQFAAAGGSELGWQGKPGKMMSLRSSSALGYNFFAPWCGASDLSALTNALGQSLADTSIDFERKFPHGLSTEPPNLDIVLGGNQARPLAIESKFTEPYGPKPPHAELAAKYFSGGAKRWADVGLPRCQLLAEAVGRDVTFVRLGAGQLLKHLLGLAFTTKLKPRLLCIWYDTGCNEAEQHREEIALFSGAIGTEVEFTVRSYQEVFRRLKGCPDPVPGYMRYLGARYFAV